MEDVIRFLVDAINDRIEANDLEAVVALRAQLAAARREVEDLRVRNSWTGTTGA